MCARVRMRVVHFTMPPPPTLTRRSHAHGATLPPTPTFLLHGLPPPDHSFVHPHPFTPRSCVHPHLVEPQLTTPVTVAAQEGLLIDFHLHCGGERGRTLPFHRVVAHQISDTLRDKIFMVASRPDTPNPMHSTPTPRACSLRDQNRRTLCPSGCAAGSTGSAPSCAGDMARWPALNILRSSAGQRTVSGWMHGAQRLGFSVSDSAFRV